MRCPRLRIPTSVLSPFAAAHTVSHQYSEHSSVIQFINNLFGLIPLASLPSEAAATAKGATLGGVFNAPAGFQGSTAASPQYYPGPADANTNMGGLREAFDNDRLLGTPGVPLLAAPVIPTKVVTSLPHFGVTTGSISAVSTVTNFGCQNLGIIPTDYQLSTAPSAAVTRARSCHSRSSCSTSSCCANTWKTRGSRRRWSRPQGPTGPWSSRSG